MVYALGKKSRANLEGVHPDLVRVVEHAITVTAQDFTVFEGLRTAERQRKLFNAGASETLNSKHIIQADGYGHAVDLLPVIDGTPRWEWPAIYPIAAAMRIACAHLGVRLVWGGVWDRPLTDLTPGANNLEASVHAYADRRRAAGHRKVFTDGPHYQLGEPA